MTRSLLIALAISPLLLQATPNLNGCNDPGPTPTPVPPPPTPVNACQVTGCSGQVCAAEPVITTCEYRCEYGCYQYATCELQSVGSCGWTSTPEFDACIAACKI